MPKKPDKQALLDQIRVDILKNNVCPNLAKTATNLVMGEGNVNAGAVFIGEAPGKQEDQKGLPFVGASGRFLDEMLSTVGMKRHDVYITNIVKYRPPDNRDPLASEKQEFWPYLLRQLAIIQPKVVVTLGRHSMEYFLPGEIISDVHGKPRQVSLNFEGKNDADTITVLPLYHPAAAMYNGSLRQTLIEDFSEVSKLLTKEFN